MAVDYYDRRLISVCPFICCCYNNIYNSKDETLFSVLLRLLIILPSLNWRIPSPSM